VTSTTHHGDSQRSHFPTWSTLPVIFMVGLLAYGVLLPWLGFYWDDWAKISVARLFGLSGYWNYYAEDRPLSSWTHIVFTPLLGTQPLTWQIFQFILVVATAWALYWCMTRLLPQRRQEAVSTALVFLVYPAFTAHPTAVTFHQQWLQYLFYFLSIGCMLAAVRARQSSLPRFLALTTLSLLLSVLQLSVTEYFASLELLRPVLLWFALGSAAGRTSNIKQRLTQTARFSAPYLVLFAFYGVWRLFFLKLSGEEPYRMVTLAGLLSDPLATLPLLARTALQDSLHTLISVWGPLVVAGKIEKIAPFQILALLLSLAAGALTLIFLSRLEPGKDSPGETPDPKPAWHPTALWVGVAAFGLGMLPAWLTGRSVLDDFHADRYALPALFGASLLWVGLIDWLTPKRMQRALLVALMVGLGTNLQLRTGNEYRWLWESQTRFFWQLYWRAPQLEPGTALLSYQEIFPNQGLFSSSSALNLLYPHTPDPQRQGESLSYWWYTLSPRYDIQKITLPLNLTFSSQFRSLIFKGSSPNTLLVHYDPSHSNCLWVITDQDQNEPGLPGLVTAMRSTSNTRKILNQPLNGWQPPEELFGPEPQHDWCYLYEKADLAVQYGDWQAAASLGDQAREMGYSPTNSRSNSPREWKPFIEAYARLGRWQEAAELTLQAEQNGKEFQVSLSSLWQRLDQEIAAGPGKQEAIQNVQSVLSQEE